MLINFPLLFPFLCVAHMWSKMFNVALSLDYVKQNVPQIERSESWLGKLYTVLYYGWTDKTKHSSLSGEVEVKPLHICDWTLVVQYHNVQSFLLKVIIQFSFSHLKACFIGYLGRREHFRAITITQKKSMQSQFSTYDLHLCILC